MRRTSALLATALLMGQCAATDYQRPEPTKADIEAAATAIRRAEMPVRSTGSDDQLIDMADRAARRLRSNLTDICTVIASDTCSFALRITQDDSANAFLDAKGNIWVTLKLLRHLGTEDEVGAVLAHEIGHRLNGDDLVAMSAIRNHQALGYFRGGSSPSAAASRISGAARYAISREANADYLAAFLLKRAGYDLHKAETVWITLYKLRDRQAASMLATHPLSAYRLAAWRKIARALDAHPNALPEMKEE